MDAKAGDGGDDSSCRLLGLSIDLLLEIVQFLNAPSLASLAQCDRLLCVLAADERTRQPAFTAVHGHISTLADTARERYPAAGPPNVGLLFTNISVHAPAITKALERLPRGLKLIGARTRGAPLLAKDVSTCTCFM